MENFLLKCNHKSYSKKVNAKNLFFVLAGAFLLVFLTSNTSALFVGNNTIHSDGVYNYTANKDFNVTSLNYSFGDFQVDGVPYCAWANKSFFTTKRICFDNTTIINSDGNTVSFADANGSVNNSGNIVRGTNATFNVTITNQTAIDKVWIKIWEGVIGSTVKFLGYLTNVIGDVWQIVVSTNSTFNNTNYNYTIFANTTTGIESNFNASFNLSGPKIDSVILNSTFRGNTTVENLTANVINVIPSSSKVIYDWRKNGSSIAVLNMPFDSGTSCGVGSNLTCDYSSFGNNGTLGDGTVGTGPTWNLTGGHDEKGAYEFDGINDRITTSLDVSTEFVNGYTLAAWVKHNDYSDIYTWVFGTSDSFLFGKGGTSESLRFATIGGDLDATGINVSDGNWHYLVASWNSGTNVKKIYYDGVNVAEAVQSGTRTGTLELGARSAVTQFWNGSIDEVMVFNRSLSAEQISALYNNGTDLIVSQETNSGENWSVMATPVYQGKKGFGVLSNNMAIITSSIGSVILNATSSNNLTTDNLTANIIGLNPSNANVSYEWFKNGEKKIVPYSVSSNVSFKMDFNPGHSNKDLINNVFGTVNGNSIYSSSQGYLSSGAYDFLGFTGDYINFSDLDVYDVGSEYVIAAWIKPKDLVGWDFIITKSDSGSNRYGLVTQSQGIGMSYSSNSASTCSGSVVNTNVWQQIAVRVINSTSYRCYINGVYYATGTGNSLNNLNPTGPLVIGGNLASNEIFKGILDDVVIINGALTDSDVFDIYNQTKKDKILSEETSVGENWGVMAIPVYNGEAGAGVLSNNLTINSLSIDSVVLNSTSTNNLTSDNLTAYAINLSPSDAKVIYDWRVNGTPIVLLNLPFDGNNATSQYIKDYSMYNNTVYKGSTGTSDDPKYNVTGGYDGKGAMYFPSGNGDERITIRADLNGSLADVGDNITISLWTYYDGTIGSIDIIYQDWYKDTERWQYGIDGNGKLFLYDDINNTGKTFTSNFTFSKNTWYYVTVVAGDRNWKIYANGNLVLNNDSASGIMDLNSSSRHYFGLRRLSSALESEWNGFIDEIMIFNRSLSQEQIRAIYNNRTDLIVSQETSVGENWSVNVIPYTNDNTTQNYGTGILSNNITINSDNVPQNITLISPVNATSTSNASLTFIFNATDDVALKNATLYVWNSSGVFGTNTTNWTGTVNETSLDLSGFTVGDYEWNVLVYDNANQSNWSSSNYTFTIIPEIDSIILNSSSLNNLTSDNLTANVNGLNPSGANVSYEWFKDGTFQSQSVIDYSNGYFSMSFDLADGVYNNSFAKDLSGNVNGAFFGSSVTYNSTGGEDGKGGYEFGGDPGTGSINITGLTTGSNFTIVSRVRASSNKGRYILDCGSGRIVFFLTYGNLSYYDGTEFNTLFNIAENVWHTVAVSQVDTNITVYFNGQTESFTGSANSLGGECTIGARYNNRNLSGDNWNGSIGEMYVFNEALSIADITRIDNRSYFLSNGVNGSTISSALTSVDEVWSVNVTPSYGGINGTAVQSNNITILSDNAPRNVTLITPVNATSTSNTSLTFMFNATDDFGLVNATLYVWNSTGVFGTNATNWTGIANSTNLSLSGLSVGNYTWNVLVYDNNGNSNWSSSNFSFTIVGLPSVEITYPVDKAAYGSNITTINYTSTELGSCWYSTDSGTTNSSSVVAGISFTNLNLGTSNISVYCNNSAGDVGQNNINFIVGNFTIANEINKMLASDIQASDYFGYSVSISGDYAIVGANNKNSSTGAAYIFKKNSTGQYEEVNKIIASDAQTYDRFGQSVSISGDYAIVGANNKNSSTGAAYIFKKNSTGQYEEVNKIQASDKQINDQFGYSVSISGDYAIVGANYEDTGGTDAGAAYIFKKNSTGQFVEVNKIQASDIQASDYFGYSVSISGDYAIVGAAYEDTGGIYAGAAYIFKKNSTGQFVEVNKIQASDKQASDYFGISVIISGDYAIAGAYNKSVGGTDAGAAYIFKKNSTGQFVEVNKIQASDKQAGDNFGQSVSISGDYVIVGANGENAGGNNAGAGYIYKKNSTGQYEEVNKIIASDAQTYDRFGASVSISGDFVIVGSPYEDTGATNAGAIYSFQLFALFNISLISPINDSQTTNNSLTFGFNVTNGNSLTNATLYVWNSTGVFGTNSTNITGTFNETNLSLEGFNTGNYKWNVLSYDSKGRSNWGSSNWSFTIIPKIDSVVLNATSTNNLTSDNLIAYAINSSPSDAKVAYIWKNNFVQQQILYVTMDGSNTTRCTDYAQGADCLPTSAGSIQYSPNQGFNGRGTYIFSNDDYININPDINTKAGSNWSISVWFNSTAVTTSTHTIFTDGSANALRQQIQIGQRSNTGYLFCGTYGDDLDTTINIQDNQWHNAVCSFDDSTKNLTLYYDGVQVGSKILGGSISVNGETVIGARPDGSAGFTDYWQGSIDEVMYWNRTLSQDMVTILATNNGTLSTIASTETISGQNWSVCGTPSDNVNDGAEVCSNNITINSAPTGCPTTPQNWNVNMSQNYVINSLCNLTGYNITFSGIGNLTINSTIYVNEINNLSSNMTVWMKSNATMWMGKK